MVFISSMVGIDIMDTEVLKAITDCKKCHFWRDYIGKCMRPSNIDCPEGVRKPQQDVAVLEYRSLT